jgi:hypothetical protein
MSSKFFSGRGDKKIDDKFNTKNASSARTNNKKNNSGIKKSGRGK